MTNVVRALFISLIALAVAGCQNNGTNGQAQPLAAVSPEPAASPGAPIASIAPTGTADTLAQIRVVFSDDLIPLEKLESPDETGVLAKFSIAPALPGHFRFLTPRMIGFQADAALPVATRVRVTVGAGVRDLHGHALDRDFSWTFNTAEIALGDLPLQTDAKSNPEPGPLDPKIRVSSNTALDVSSLAAHGSLVPDGGGAAIGLTAPPAPATSATDSPPPVEAFDPSEKAYAYVLVPSATLAKGTTYRVVFAPGINSKVGNLPSSAEFSGRLRTYGPLTFTGLTQEQGQTDRIDSGTPQLTFSNPIYEKTLAAIHVSPAPAAGTAVGRMGESTIGINPALLAPNTDYTVTMDATLADTFGQKLGTAQTTTFRTTDLAPMTWAPTGTNLFPAPLKVALNVSGTNIGAAAHATFAKLQPSDVVQYADPGEGDSPLFGIAAAKNTPLALNGAPNTERTIELPLRAQLGGPAGTLAYRVTGPNGTVRDANGRESHPDTDFVGLVQLTNLGAFAQWFPDSGLVRVNHLSNGGPAANVRVDVYRSQTDDKAKSGVSACATAQTGADGIARFGGAAFATCAALDKGLNNAPSLVTVATEGTDWAYVRTDDSTGPYSSGLDTGWSSATPISRGTIFSDRDLYQQGEQAKLTAVGWFLTHGVLGRGKAASYNVELQFPNQEKRTLPRITLNAYGTASIPITIDKDAPLGYYNVHATAGNGETLDGSFRVAQFKPPNFSVALALPVAVAVAGDTVAANTTSMYLFGSPVAGASTAYSVTRSITNYTWTADTSYSFGRQWFWPENTPDVSSDVFQKTVTVDATGHATAGVPVDSALPYPMTYRVDADTTDVANLTVGDSKSFTAFAGPVQIGLKTDFVATAGQPAKVSVVALDANGKAVPKTSVHVELQSATYVSATAVVEGGDSPEQSVKYDTVATADITSGDTATVAQLTPPKAGTYRIRANVAGAKSDATETDVQLYVTGAGDAAWGSRDPNILDVHLDKTTYKPGDTARAIVQSPFPDADVLVAVVRNGVMWQQRVQTHGSAPSFSFTVTPAMLPNAAFEAVAVRRGALPSVAPADTGNAVVRSGFVSFNVALDSKYVVVTATPANAKLQPGAHQTVKLHLTDKQKQAVQGQVTLIVANDAVLQLSGYRPPDLVQMVYGSQPISTRFADNRTTIVLQTPKRDVDKGWGYGGGLSAGAEDTRIRKKFDALAYYAASIVTDANGDAVASFDLPDDLTTWRVMAVAATADGRFGNGEATFLTNKPLIVNPVVPQFARPGDAFDAGISLTTTAAAGKVAISGALTPPLSFIIDGKPAAATTFSAPEEQITKAYRFPMLAGGPGTSTATFRAKSDANGAADAFAIPVEVVDRAVMESVITTGVLPNGNVKIPLDIAAGTPTDAGGLQLIFANSLIPDAVVAAQNAFVDDDRIAISAAGRLTIAADLVRLAKLTNGTPEANAAKRAATAIATLDALQRADGGFASYTGAKSSDPYDSLDVLHAYARASGAGIAVDPQGIASAKQFAAKVLADPASWSWCKTDPCKSQLRLHALDALRDAGDARTTYLGDIDAQRAKFSVADQIRLARLMVLSPGYAARGAAEAKALGDRVYITGATATFNVPERYSWYSSLTVTQSLMTQLLIAQHAEAATIDKMTRSLLSLRKNGSWGCACMDAAALDALVDVARAAGPPPNANASATLGGTTVAHAAFANHRAGVQTMNVPAARLPRGSNPLTLTTNPGPLHYAVTYSYRLAGDQRGRLNGLRVTRVVHPAGAASALATMGMSVLSAPVAFAPANVYDIELQIITDHPIDRVQIMDPLPAGMEAVDTSFKTTNAANPGMSWQIDDQQIFRDRVEAYADHLGPGVYSVHYLARTVTPGTFSWPGAQARLIDHPEEFGRSATATLTIK